MNDSRYRGMIGVGGIGSGAFFALSGNHTLGRGESRGGRFLDRRDYCKLHIISHYVNVLLGSEFETILIGRVGDDQAGQSLLQEMRQAGLDCRFIEVVPGEQTLYSFCFLYPDGSGGNLTTDNSANALVDPAFVKRAEPEFARLRGAGVALAAPEAPLPARQKLLELGSTYGFLRVLGLTTEETRQPLTRKMLSQTDLLALNLDEAMALVGRDEVDTSPNSVVQAAASELRQIKPDMAVSITAGDQGSWLWNGESLVHRPVLPVSVINTAGAGDAHLAGIIVGLVAGLEMHQAHQLGTLVGAMSVTSPHTINPEVNRTTLLEFAESIGAPLSAGVAEVVAHGAPHLN